MQQALDPLPLVDDALCGEPMQGFAHDDDHVHALGQPFGQLSVGLAHEPLGSIAYHRTPDPSRNRDAKPGRSAKGTGRHQENEVLRRDASSARLDAEKVLSTTKPLLARQTQGW
jgi:hypothetical protein